MRALILGALILMGCAWTNTETARQLNQFDPMTADPADFAMVIDLPPGLRMDLDASTLTFRARRSDTGEEAGGQFALVEVSGPGGATVYALAPSEVAAFRAAQVTIGAWEEAAPDASTGELSLGLAACADGEGPAKDATVSAGLRLEAEGPVLPLIENMPIREILRASAGTTTESCGSSG